MPRKGTNGTEGNRKYHNITIDADVHAAIILHQERLKWQFGFKPSLSQVVRHLIFTGGGMSEEPSWTNPDGPTAA